MPKKQGNRVCILLHLQLFQWHTVVIIQVVSLNSCDLHMKYLNYYQNS